MGVFGFEPGALPELGARLGPWLSALAACGGLGLAFYGTDRWLLRPLAATLAGLAAFALVDRAFDPDALGIDSLAVRYTAAGAFGVFGFLWPVVASAIFFALAFAQAGAELLPLPAPWMRSVAAGAAGLLFGAIFWRPLLAVAAAFLGAALTSLGLVGLAVFFGAGYWVEKYPVLPLFPLVLIFVAGAAYQLSRPPPRRLEEET